MNNRLVHISASIRASLSTWLLTIAGERAGAANEFPTKVARNSRTSTSGSALERAEARPTFCSFRRKPQTPGPFLTLILTLCRRSPAADDGKRESSGLPNGARFVVRYSSQ